MAKQVDLNERLRVLTQQYREALKQSTNDETTERLMKLSEQIDVLARQKKLVATKKHRERELSTVKEYVLSAMDSSPETKSTGSRKLPNNLTVHKLNSRGNQLLLLGV